MFEALPDCKQARTLILAAEDSARVDALQRRAAVVLQKSLREGFGLTVTEAMWKGAAVVGGDCGGIRRQIEDGKGGFLASSVEQAAARIVQLVQNRDLRRRLGNAARESVRRHFLMSRLAELYHDLFAAFELRYPLKEPRGGKREFLPPRAVLHEGDRH